MGTTGQLHIDTGGVQLTADSTYPVEQLAQFAPNPELSMLSGLGKQVYLACGYTDMRKSINRLMSIAEGSFLRQTVVPG